MIFTAGWDFTISNYDTVWGVLIQLTIVLTFLFLGNLIRNVIPVLKKSLTPSALIGGLLLWIVNLILKEFGIEIIDKSFMQIITYHALGIGFIAMTLKVNRKSKKVDLKKAVENAAMTGGTYMLQAIVGIVITIVFYLFTKNNAKPYYPYMGALLPLGYGQGPGNALTWDVNFSAILDNNGTQVFFGNGSVGLTIASVGFLVASIFGVFYINYQKSKGRIKSREENLESKRNSLQVFPDEIPESESIDKFTIQVGIVAICYLLTFLIMYGIGSINSFFNSTAWGFNFIWGCIVASLFKIITGFLKKKKVIHRTYISNYQMDRISGFSFDLMIVAGVVAIEMNDVIEYIWPIIVLCTIGAVVTFLYVKYVSKHCFKGYEHEMFVLNFGTLTGTASNGMILLKEIDPNYETPASDLFVVSQFPAMIFVAPLLILIGFGSKSFTNTLIVLGIFTILFIAYNIFLFRDLLFKKKAK